MGAESSKESRAETAFDLFADVSLDGVSLLLVEAQLMKRLLLFSLYSRNSRCDPGNEHLNVTDWLAFMNAQRIFMVGSL